MWLFFGDKALPADERPPIPYASELDDPNWRAVYGECTTAANNRLSAVLTTVCLH